MTAFTDVSLTTLLGLYSYAFEVTLLPSKTCYQPFYYNFGMYWAQTSGQVVDVYYMPYNSSTGTCVAPTWNATLSTPLGNNTFLASTQDTLSPSASSATVCAYFTNL